MPFQQYRDAKALCPDALLLFRVGDFYEAFHDDAKVAARVLGLTLTTRCRDNPVPMVGVPYHYIHRYVADLVAAGHRVAVCEQVPNVPTGAGVERIVTGGDLIKA